MPQFLIRQQFTNEEVTALAPKIHSIIGTDSHLTVRSRPWIHKRLMNGEWAWEKMQEHEIMEQ